MYRILRRDDKERIGQATGCTINRDLMLFHGFQQGTLRLRCGAIDFVGQHHLGKDRTGVKAEIALLAVENGNAEDVGRQHVAGELHALELQPQQAGQGMRQGGLADARHVFNQQMAPGEQAGEGEAELPVLAENDLAGGLERSGQRGGDLC